MAPFMCLNRTPHKNQIPLFATEVEVTLGLLPKAHYTYTHIKRSPNSCCVFRSDLEDTTKVTAHSQATGPPDLAGGLPTDTDNLQPHPHPQSISITTTTTTTTTTSTMINNKPTLATYSGIYLKYPKLSPLRTRVSYMSMHIHGLSSDPGCIGTSQTQSFGLYRAVYLVPGFSRFPARSDQTIVSHSYHLNT